ncbi:MAG: FtsX-like permease family protein [Spirochaetaceae bacterium]|nr:FtsX-like permease family protein [Spirochaetaceae bacterium]
MIFLLAVRNILRNKKNSVVIMLLIGVISALFFIGNSVFARSNRGLRQSYVDNLTGDIIIEKKADVTMNLFGANAPIIGEYFAIPVLGAYNDILKELSVFPEIEGYAGQVSVICKIDALDTRSNALLCGVDAASYFDMFPGIEILEGSFLAPGEYGAMITRRRADEIEKSSGKKVEIGMPLLFTSAGESGFKIRETPLTGIFSYTAKGQFMDEIVIVDVQTARALAAIQIATSDVEPDAEEISLLDSALGIDDLFDAEAPPGYSAPDDTPPETSVFEHFFLEGETENAEGGGIGEIGGGVNDFSGGDWNFIILRLEKGASAGRVIAELNKVLPDFDAVALDWRFAAGNAAILILLLQTLFNSGAALAGLTGVIAIINIMLIAVFRRTREIGTLRAIGASGAYIRSLILCENSVIGVFAGFTGIASGALVLNAVNRLHITIENELIAGLLGGDVLTIDFSMSAAILSFTAALVLSVLASIYPVETAVKIQPIVAIRN